MVPLDKLNFAVDPYRHEKKKKIQELAQCTVEKKTDLFFQSQSTIFTTLLKMVYILYSHNVVI